MVSQKLLHCYNAGSWEVLVTLAQNKGLRELIFEMRVNSSSRKE